MQVLFVLLVIVQVIIILVIILVIIVLLVAARAARTARTLTAAAVSAWFSSVPLRLIGFDSNQVHTLASSDSLHFQKMAQKYHVKIEDLQASVAQTIAKEVLIVRVLRPRFGMAGQTQKWECDLIDGNNTRSVLLADAWGKNIDKAKEILKEGQVYKISNYVIADKGKATPFGNNLLKLPVNAKVSFENVTGEHPEIPLELPLEDLENVINLKAARVVSLNLAVATPAEQKSVEIKRSNTTKIVVNVMMKAKHLKIELAAWGKLAQEMSGRSADVRLDAVLVQPALDGGSVKLSTLDCTSIRDLTQDETDALHNKLTADENLESLTKTSFAGGKRQSEMSQKASVTNIETISMLLRSEFDPNDATQHEKIEKTFEIPSVMVMAIGGTDDEDGSALSYRACEKCKLKKLGKDGNCTQCGSSEYVERLLLRCTLIDPTASVVGVMYHQSASEFMQDEDLLLTPVVALVHVAPDIRTPGKHALEIYAIKPMFTATGVLNVFRAPPVRFDSSGDKAIPAYPNDVETNSMEQNIVNGTCCSYIRFLLKITTPKAITEVKEGVDGMRCEHTAECCLTSTAISLQLAGSFDTVAALYRLTKKDSVHVLCTPTHKSNSAGLAVYKPTKIYVIAHENMDTLLKTFKFEVAQTKTHNMTPVEISSVEKTPDIKSKSESRWSSPGWESPQRRLKVSKTDEATSAGIQRL